MSHITIIISRSDPTVTDEYALQPSYEYSIPVPHGATPQQVAELVRCAYKRLEGEDD